MIQSHIVTNEAYAIENNPQKVIMVFSGQMVTSPHNGDKDSSSTGTISQPRRQPASRHNLANAGWTQHTFPTFRLIRLSSNNNRRGKKVSDISMMMSFI